MVSDLFLVLCISAKLAVCYLFKEVCVTPAGVMLHHSLNFETTPFTRQRNSFHAEDMLIIN